MELGGVSETHEEQQNLGLPVVTCHSAIFSIADNQLMLLLAERNEGPFRFQWELPGIIPALTEELSASAIRASTPPLAPSVVDDLQQLGVYGEPTRDPRHRSIALVYWGVTHHSNIDTASSELALIPVSEWQADDFRFAFDHLQIATDAFKALRRSLNSTSLATRLCGSTFTISDLQHVYELTFDTEVLAGNFHRKVQSTPGFVTSAQDQTQEPKRKGRPAQRFESSTIVEVSPPFQFQAEPTHHRTN